MLRPKSGWNWLIVFGEEDFWLSFRYFLVSPLGKGCVPSIEYAWIPLTQECFTPSFVEIGPVVLEKKLDENVQKFTTTIDDDDGQILIRKDHLTFDNLLNFWYLCIHKIKV